MIGSNLVSLTFVLVTVLIVGVGRLNLELVRVAALFVARNIVRFIATDARRRAAVHQNRTGGGAVLRRIACQRRCFLLLNVHAHLRIFHSENRARGVFHLLDSNVVVRICVVSDLRTADTGLSRYSTVQQRRLLSQVSARILKKRRTIAVILRRCANLIVSLRVVELVAHNANRLIESRAASSLAECVMLSLFLVYGFSGLRFFSRNFLGPSEHRWNVLMERGHTVETIAADVRNRQRLALYVILIGSTDVDSDGLLFVLLVMLPHHPRILLRLTALIDLARNSRTVSHELELLLLLLDNHLWLDLRNASQLSSLDAILLRSRDELILRIHSLLTVAAVTNDTAVLHYFVALHRRLIVQHYLMIDYVLAVVVGVDDRLDAYVSLLNFPLIHVARDSWTAVALVH